jgi:hypothetical protein
LGFRKLCIFTALVTFERAESETQFLPSDAQGACGYMAIAMAKEDYVFDALRSELAEVGLRLIEVEQVAETTLATFPDDLDEHLAENVCNWESGRQTVWGTIHAYIADGEA